MISHDLSSALLRILILLVSCYAGYTLSVFYDNAAKINVVELKPWVPFSMFGAVALIAGPFATLFALENAVCFFLLAFRDYPILYCTSTALFSVTYRFAVYASWVNDWNYVFPRGAVIFLPVYGAIMLGVLLMYAV